MCNFILELCGLGFPQGKERKGRRGRVSSIPSFLPLLAASSETLQHVVPTVWEGAGGLSLFLGKVDAKPKVPNALRGYSDNHQDQAALGKVKAKPGKCRHFHWPS